MSAPKARRATWPALLFAVSAAGGCNAIIGADQPTLRGEEASTAQECVLNSNCTTPGQVCIFRVCSPPCQTDDDCSAGSRCLKTQVGTACVANAVDTCGGTTACPPGATCTGSACRNECTPSSACLTGQDCV